MGSRRKRFTSRLAALAARLFSPRSRRWLKVFAAILLAPWIALLLAAAMTPLPPELDGKEPYGASIVFFDRHGTEMREVRAGDGHRARWVRLGEMGDAVPRAILAAEDRRFYRHPGIDPLAMARALGQMGMERRVVSGASTLTQQLARNLVKRPRTVTGKLREMALALRIEASLTKQQILEHYLNRIHFGPGLRGIEAASRFYFDKSPAELSLAEAAALASLPRGPSLYDPRRGTDLLLKRRSRVLERMAAAGLASQERVDRAKEEPFALAPRGSTLGAPHFVRGILSGAIDSAAGAIRGRARSVTTTLDRGLQREIEVLALRTVEDLSAKQVSAAAVVVIENATRDILAYVGSPDIENDLRLGHNDGVLALRQPGSTLKPFLYELAMERLGFSAATLLPDVDLHFPEPGGDYHPQNYDGRLHGPVLVREALANSYNIPAVWTVAALGPDRLLERLRSLGLSTLREDATHYGLALALGDGEVRLLDLAAAYATLARGGLYLPPRAVRAAESPDGTPISLPPPEPHRVLAEVETHIIADILADNHARLASFGEGSALELPFPVAAKTGTSKGYRDNFTAGFTPAVTVAVWVGNFDGSPMQGVSGVSGAGPLFRDAMMAAARLYPPRPFELPRGAVTEAEVCSLSGMRPTPVCPHRRREMFSRGNLPGAPCELHEEVRIDTRNGLRAGPRCPGAFVEARVLERYDAPLNAWAKSAGRPVAPEGYSPLCPGHDAAPRQPRLRVAFPPDGARFSRDPGLASPQSIRIRIDAPSGIAGVSVEIDGRTVSVAGPPFAVDWPLVPGSHRVRALGRGDASDMVEFFVD